MNREPENNWQSLSPFLIVVLMAVGAYWAPWPLEGERPQQEYVGLSQEGLQQADARLWQDPFAAAEKHYEQKLPLPTTELGLQIKKLLEERPKPTREVVRQMAELVRKYVKQTRDMAWLSTVVKEKCEPPKDCRVTVMGVMVDGGPYVGMEESRRRTRYAVLAGLKMSGFNPDDPEHIGYVVEGAPRLPTLVPFEWLTSENGHHLVLLLWLDEGVLVRELAPPSNNDTENGKQESKTDGVLKRLAVLLKPLISKEEKDDNRKLHLIGPANSGTLIKIAKELPEDGQPPPPLDQALLYSPFATAGDAWEQVNAKWQEIPEGPNKGFSIARVIAKDEQLVEELVEELMRRGIQKGDRVALVGQWDTDYSRYLVTQLEKQLEDVQKLWVTQRSYLRGIDGRLPGTEPNKENKQGKEDQKDNTRVERPEGDAQIDHLRRLTTELARQQKAEQGKIKAIGVIGNDYHDKLLALKALRPAFPEAVLFTTDLDAAMLHPADNVYTRNLVVASAYDLTLIERLQGGLPPFRDSYQTAAFLATRIAMLAAGPGAGKLDQEILDPLRDKSLIYEIGRTEPVRLNNPEQSPECKSLDECTDPHPWREIKLHPLVPLSVGLMLIAGGMLLCRISRRFCWFSLGYWRGLAVAVGIVSVILFAVWLYFQLPNPLDEPFSWIEGVSVWPTEILRVVAIVLALFFFLKGVRDLRHCDEETHRGFSHDGEEERQEDERHIQAINIWRLYRARQINVSQLDDHLGECRNGGTVAVVPSREIGHFFRQNRMAVVCYLLLGLGLVLALGAPHVPVRGEWMRRLDFVILFAAVVCFAMLLFFVLDASRRATWLAENLGGKTSWPEATLRRFGKPDKIDPKYFDDWLDVRVLASASRASATLVYYPFIVFFVLLLSRSSLFDAWYTPPALYLIFALALLLMIFCAWQLRHAAENTRVAALRRMSDAMLEVEGQEGKERLVSQIKTMIEQVQSPHVGAFAPFSQQPIVRAVLVLAGSVSGLALVEYVSFTKI